MFWHSVIPNSFKDPAPAVELIDLFLRRHYPDQVQGFVLDISGFRHPLGEINYTLRDRIGLAIEILAVETNMIFYKASDEEIAMVVAFLHSYRYLIVS